MDGRRFGTSHCPTLAKLQPFRKRKQRSNRWSLILLAAFLGYSVYQCTTTGKVDWLTEVFQRIEATVVGVTDGDTVTVLGDGSQRHKIRLHGSDTPERGQPHYRQAKDAPSGLIAGATVGIGVIYHNNQNINLARVRQGHA